MPSKHIDILYLPAGKPAEKRSIENTLQAQQRLVNGPVEYFTLKHTNGGSLDIVCHEEGKLIEFPPNLLMPADIIVGDIFLTRVDYDSGENISLLPEDYEWFETTWEPRRFR